jgi:RND superfamily putative drug exporter
MQRDHGQSAAEAPAAPAIKNTDALESQPIFRLGQRLGQTIYRFRWGVLALWTVALLVSLPFATRISGVLTGGGYTVASSESIRVQTIAQQKLHQPVAQVSVIFQSATIPTTAPTYQQEVAGFTSRAQHFAHVTNVVPVGIGKDGRTMLIAVDFNQSVDALEQHLDAFIKLLPSGANQPARAYVTGDVAVYQAISQIASTDAEKADATVLPFALIVLLLVFATVVAALMPLLLALVAVPIALAIIFVIAQHIITNTIVFSIASVIGLGLSIDYSLFMVRRFREELANGRAVPEAIGWTIATAGEAILFSGLTVTLGFCALLLLNIPVMTSVGLSGAAVVIIAVLVALTLLPALLGILGPRINALGLPFMQRFQRTTRPVGQEGFWHRLAMGVMQRPVLVIGAVSIVLLGLGWPVLSMKVGTPDYHTLPTTSTTRQGINILYEQFPALQPLAVYLLVQTRDGSPVLTSQNLTKLATLTTWLGRQPHITSVSSLTAPPAVAGATPPTMNQLIALYTTGAYAKDAALAAFVAANAAGNTTLITASSDTKLDSDAGVALVQHLRGNAPPRQGLTVLVGGLQAITYDFNQNLYGNFPRAIAFILITTFLLLLVMFRSLLLPLKAVLMNILSISVAYGVLVWIFQWGNLSHLLGFTSEGFVETTVPILLFCILFGLSMDYEVFLLSRIREEWLRTHNNRAAVAQGLEKTGGTITSAALILAIVTAAIATTTLLATKETGLGMTVAVLVDATIIRSLLVPATMRLLGKWNWWFPGQPVPHEQSFPSTNP